MARQIKGRARRPRGEGELKQLPDGRWRVRLRVGARQYRRTAGTQAEALAALRELKDLAASGVPARRYTVGDALDDFLRHGETSRGWAPATVRSYRSTIEVHLRPALGRALLRELAIHHVQRLLDRLLASGHSGRHVSQVRGVLRTAIAHAMRRELVSRNVAAIAAAPPVRREEMRAVSASELASLFDALEGERLRPLIVTAATLGLRRGELIALRWSDLDLLARTLTVRRTGARIRREYVEASRNPRAHAARSRSRPRSSRCCVPSQPPSPRNGSGSGPAGATRIASSRAKTAPS